MKKKKNSTAIILIILAFIAASYVAFKSFIYKLDVKNLFDIESDEEEEDF